MKKIIYLITLVLFGIFTFMSCESQTENQIENFKSTEEKLEHNLRIKNIIHKLEDKLKSVQTISNEYFINVFQDEFKEELSKLKDNKYYELYANPFRYRKVSKALVANIFDNESLTIKDDDLALELYNDILLNIPHVFLIEIKDISKSILRGDITPENIDEILTQREIDFFRNNNINEDINVTIKSAYETFKQSYILWHPKKNGGDGYFFRYLQVRDNIEFYKFNNSNYKINDNDWPEGATTPKWLDNDVIGGSAGGLTGGWFGALVGAVAGSLMT